MHENGKEELHEKEEGGRVTPWQATAIFLLISVEDKEFRALCFAVTVLQLHSKDGRTDGRCSLRLHRGKELGASQERDSGVEGGHFV